MESRVRAYLEWVGKKKAEGTGRNYAERLKRLARDLGDLDNLTWHQLEDWGLTHTELTSGTRRGALMVLSGYYTWSIEEGYRTENPVQQIPRSRRLKVPDVPPKILPWSTATSMAAATHVLGKQGFLRMLTREEHMLINLLVYTGSRVSEALQLRRADVDIIDGFVTFRVTKGEKPRQVPIVKQVKPVATDYLDGLQTDKLFAHRTNLYRWSNYCVHVVGRTCGADSILGRPCRCHDLRKAFGNHLAETGVPMKAIAQILGHSSMEVTAKYYLNFDKAQLAALVAV